LTATITTASNSQLNYAMKLQVLDGITNPPSIYSDNISVYIYDRNGVTRDYNDAIKVKYLPETLKGKYNNSDLFKNISYKDYKFF
jgi:hypothetical protein